MPRLIDADALGIGKANRDFFNDPKYADGWNSAIEIINNATTIEAEPVRHGRWENEPDFTFGSYLGLWKHRHKDCGYTYSSMNENGDPYCPNCGAKMVGDNHET